MRAALRSVDLEPDPRSLPDDPAQFATVATLYVGRADSVGQETFQVTVCSPEWLAANEPPEGIRDGLHHVIVSMDRFDERQLHAWFERRVTATEGPDWQTIAVSLSRLGWWEFDGYRP